MNNVKWDYLHLMNIWSLKFRIYFHKANKVMIQCVQNTVYFRIVLFNEHVEWTYVEILWNMNYVILQYWNKWKKYSSAYFRWLVKSENERKFCQILNALKRRLSSVFGHESFCLSHFIWKKLSIFSKYSVNINLYKMHLTCLDRWIMTVDRI